MKLLIVVTACLLAFSIVSASTPTVAPIQYGPHSYSGVPYGYNGLYGYEGVPMAHGYPWGYGGYAREGYPYGGYLNAHPYELEALPAGSLVKADWNGDGIIDLADGWRRLQATNIPYGWDPAYRGEGWRPETVSVREVPYGVYADTDWTSVYGYINGEWTGWGPTAYATPIVEPVVYGTPYISGPVASKLQMAY